MCCLFFFSISSSSSSFLLLLLPLAVAPKHLSRLSGPPCRGGVVGIVSQGMSTLRSEEGLLANNALSRPMEVEDFQEDDFQSSETQNDKGTPYVPPTEEEYRKLLKRISDLEQKVRSVENGEGGASKFDLELPTKEQYTSGNHDGGSSSLDVEDDDFHSDRPKRIMLFGQAFHVDESFLWRVKWGQRGAGLSSFCTFLCYLMTFTFPKNIALQTLMVLFSIGILCSAITFYKNNIYSEVVKRLLKEPRVWIIIVSVIMIFLIDTLKPHNSFSWMFGLIYMVTTLNVLLLDAVRKKNRWFVIYCGALFSLINILNIYDRIFGTVDVDVVLMEYSISGKKLHFMKRDVKRSMYLNIMLFSISGIWIMLKDKEMDVMMFANGLIYRVTGEAHNRKIRQRRSNSVLVTDNKVLPFAD